MSLRSWIRQRMGGEDPNTQYTSGTSQDTGGAADADATDQHSTTGTTPNDEFVGRAAGADPAGGEPTGEDRRAQAEGQPPTEEQGANRDV